MKTVTQPILYRQALIKYSEKYGVTKAAIRYKTNRQYIYRWKKRYDGTLASLEDRSHRPHHHPNEHTADELKLIADMRKKCQFRFGSVLGKTSPKRLHTLGNRFVPSIKTASTNGG